jgi:hypothetical protein
MSAKRARSEWATPTDRVKWLLEHRHGGSRSGMAKATGVSLTGLIKVVTGQQNPGRRLLETIIQNSDISPAWLFAGEGQPFKGAAMPVTEACVSEPTPTAMGTTGTSNVPDLADLYSPTRYWLRLGRGEPAVKAFGNGVKAGDLMLMETDRSTFPSPERLHGMWGVARVRRRGESVLRLAEFEYVRESDEHDAFLQAETFAHHPQKVRRIVVDEFPDGTLEASQRAVLLGQPDAGNGERTKGRWAASILPQAMNHEDVVAVCVLLVRGFDRAM